MKTFEIKITMQLDAVDVKHIEQVLKYLNEYGDKLDEQPQIHINDIDILEEKTAYIDEDW